MSTQELQIHQEQITETAVVQAAEATPMAEIPNELLASGHRLTAERETHRVKGNGVLAPIKKLLVGENQGSRNLINQEARVGGTVFESKPGELIMFFFLDKNTIVFQRWTGPKNAPQLLEQIRYDVEGDLIYVARDGMHHQNITGTQDARDLHVAVKLAEHRTINSLYSSVNRN